ncbi:AAA family ATPase [Chitinophaga sp. SYP-B3965]|uniref:ATP-binding protein n=1 Tax=Chitinophaga sp. SYP-B3965 TaxID=2663120 RepID=UPI0012997412|nr:ATP-binding protein [Chitinophaga sp. SYP-B3965]MRG45518.1 AAA family ATPase [Chitinophaga sp. SYP-B3965]
MPISQAHKQLVHQEIITDYKRKIKDDASYTQARHAISLDINPSVYSRLMRNDIERVLSESEWKRIGMELNIDKNGLKWVPAVTSTFVHISVQLEYCQDTSISGIFCDKKGIGKSFSARHYALQRANVAYIDCSQCKTKSELIRMIARKFGFTHTGKLKDVFRNMVENILTLDKPMIILDEAGDLKYDAFLELKSLWNATEYYCANYMMGANGLKAKIDKQIVNKKVGYEEIFDRYGDTYQSLTADMDEAEVALFDRMQAVAVLKAQLPNLKKDQAAAILDASRCNQRSLRTEIIKFIKPAA